MIQNLAVHWWTLLIRGLVAILFGVIGIFWPTITLGALILLFGSYAVVDGIFTLISAFGGRAEMERWWMIALEGLTSFIMGILVFVWPGLSALVLLYFIAAWAVITGIMEIIAAYHLRKDIEGEWLLVLAGVASVSFGVIAFIAPGAGALALIFYISVFALVFGVSLTLLAFRVRRFDNALNNL